MLSITISSSKRYLFFLSIVLLYHPLSAEFSLTTIKNWFSGNQEEIVYKEEAFNKNGTITINNEHGDITIKTWSSPKLALEIIKTGSEKERTNITISTAIDKNSADIKTVPSGKNNNASINYHLMIPEEASATITTKKGNIKIKNLHGTIKADAQQGSITIVNAKQSVQAQASDSITLSCLSVPLASTLTLKTTSGPIALTIPVDTNAYLNAKTESATVTCEHFISLKPITSKLNHHTWQRFKREVHGTLGNGGALITITSQDGAIKILE